jgi:hypothetical protein
MPPLLNDPVAPPLSLPLPAFRRPISDPDLPEVGTVDPPPATSAASPGPLPPSSPGESPAPPPALNPDRPTPTRTSSAGSDPKVAREVVAGLIALACGIAFGLLGRRGLHFRQPTERQVDELATPLGSIIARHLPTEFISKDLVDATAAAGAAHRYVIDGPLVSRYAEPIPEDLP